MDDFLYFRLIFWFVFICGIAYVFLIIDLGIRLSYRVNSFSPKRIVTLLKKLVMPKNRLMGRLGKNTKLPA